MSDAPAGPGWWQAQDGRWYGPEHHPDPAHRAAYAGGALPPAGPPGSGADPASSGGSKLPLIIGGAVVVALLVAGAIFLLGGGGDDDDEVATGGGDTTTTVDEGETTTTEAETTTTEAETTTTTEATTTTTEATTGSDAEVVVTLRWNGDTDLDLRVTDPEGDTASYTSGTASGGELVQDVIPRPGDAGPHEEVILWESGAPAGSYEVLVRRIGSGDPVDFRVVAQVDGAEVFNETGTLDGFEDSGPLRFEV